MIERIQDSAWNDCENIHDTTWNDRENTGLMMYGIIVREYIFLFVKLILYVVVNYILIKYKKTLFTHTSLSPTPTPFPTIICIHSYMYVPISYIFILICYLSIFVCVPLNQHSHNYILINKSIIQKINGPKLKK